MNHMLGLEFDSCCWAVRILAGKELQKDSGNNYVSDKKILLEFELKGLGSVGKDVRSNLAKVIQNYENY